MKVQAQIPLLSAVLLAGAFACKGREEMQPQTPADVTTTTGAPTVRASPPDAPRPWVGPASDRAGRPIPTTPNEGFDPIKEVLRHGGPVGPAPPMFDEPMDGFPINPADAAVP